MRRGRFARERWASLTIAVLTALLALPLWASPWNVFDGGIAAASAGFTLHGLVPYRDYWLLYGPLSGWVLSIPTALFGPSVELTRFVGLLVLAAQAAVVYGLCRRWVSVFAAALLAVSSALLVGAFMGVEVNAWPLSMTLSLAALSLRLDARRPFVVGALLGLAFLARLDVGAYALVACVLLPDRRRLLVGFGITAFPIAAGLLLLSPLASLVEQLIWYPLVGPRQYRGVPGLEALMPTNIALPLTLILGVVPRVAIALALARAVAGRHLDLLAIAVFAALSQLQTLGRADAAHLALATTPAIVLLAAILPRTPRLSLFGVGIVAPVLFAAVVTGMGIALSASPSKDLALQRSIAVVRHATTRDQALFVGLVSNRYTLLNATLAYYLADRPPGSRWTMYNPGVTNTDATQAAMVANLEATQTNVMILGASASNAFEFTNDSRIAGSSILDRYIGASFRTWCDFGEYQVAVRVAWDPEGPCPIAGDA